MVDGVAAVDTGTLFLGRSPAMLEVLRDAEAIAASDAKVLISGESGVGKEVMARMIHARSRRRQRPMHTINCAGVPEGLLETEFFGHVRGSFTGADRDRQGFLESADTGTVLLDEVGEMSLRMQGMLLRFLESGEIQRVGSDRARTIVDVRVMAATNRDLLEQVKAREFREDLYYRLNIIHLVVPPLRERVEDISLLFEHYLAALSEKAGVPRPIIAPGVIEMLEQHEWPGNVRELRNLVERLLLVQGGRVVTPENLPLTPRRRPAAVVVSGRTPEAVADQCYRDMVDSGGSFWTVVYQPFMLRDLTRESVRHVILRGLQETKGSYRLVAQLLNLPATDYKRFMNFLQKHDCLIPFQGFRAVTASRDRAVTPHTAAPR
jgi:transcriptional regulator with GAF, ATPase, and Fis domain